LHAGKVIVPQQPGSLAQWPGHVCPAHNKYGKECIVPFESHQLSNGLQIVGETNPAARSVALGFFVRTGSRDESDEVSGVTHFLEHMVFKGTPRRNAFEVNRDFDRIGADYNAYTSEENTVFYGTILPEYVPQAVDILADILRPSLRTEDFDREKEVILEEIAMYEDQPMWIAYDRARHIYFGDHPLGNTVLGTPASITALTRDQMHEYFERRYVGPNISVVAAGNFDFRQLVGLVEERCGGWSAGPAPRKKVRPVAGSRAFEVVPKDNVTQEHVMLLSSGPAAHSPLRYAATTLALVIGDDSGSRLYWALIDPGLADSADSSFHEYEGTGSFYTSYSCEPGLAQKNLSIVRRVLQKVQKEGITEEELQQAKNKILSRVVRASERPRGRMNAVGMSWTYQQKYRTVDDELKAFAAVSQKSIRKVLDAFPLDQVTTLALGPLKKMRRPAANGKG
jgi:predicted Zn-dependent peptidase